MKVFAFTTHNGVRHETSKKNQCATSCPVEQEWDQDEAQYCHSSEGLSEANRNGHDGEAHQRYSEECFGQSNKKSDGSPHLVTLEPTCEPFYCVQPSN